MENLATNLDAVGLGKAERVPETCSHCIRKVYPPKPVTLFCSDCETSFCGNCSDAEHLKPENARHSIILESAKSKLKTGNNNGAAQSGIDDWFRPSSVAYSQTPQAPQLHSRPSSSHILDTDTIPGTMNYH